MAKVTIIVTTMTTVMIMKFLTLSTQSTFPGLSPTMRGMVMPERVCSRCNSQDPRTWLYLEKGLCRCNSGKDLHMRSSWINHLGPTSNDKCAYKRKAGGDERQREKDEEAMSRWRQRLEWCNHREEHLEAAETGRAQPC